MADVSHNPIPSPDDNASRPAHDLTEALEVLAHRAQGQLSDAAQMAFFLGDGLQRAAMDAFFDALRPQTWSPANLIRRGSMMIQQSARMSQLLAPEQAQLAWQELKNKVQVFVLVKNLPSILHLPEDDDGELIPLRVLVDKAYSLAPFQALWAVEGLGHYYAEEHWPLHDSPQKMLTESSVPIPEKSLLMLHAGIGLAFADRLIGSLTTESTEDEVRQALEQFVLLCENNSREGYLGAAIESLGIVTRDFHPELFSLVTRQFRITAPEFSGFYWHGIGRAIYFSRKFFLPQLFSMWNDVRFEAAEEADRLSVMAGLSWAFTLVNMRHPAIIASGLKSIAAQEDLANAFSNGVSSCVVMRSDTTPGESFVTALYEHKPDENDRELAPAWEESVARPAEAAVRAYHPTLKRHRALDQVFRYADLVRLVEQMETPSGTSSAAESAGGYGCCESSPAGALP